MGLKGAPGFESYYSKIYGSRWPTLKDRLLAPPRKVALLNPFHPDHATLTRTVQWLDAAPEHSHTAEGLSPYYQLDLASVMAAMALPVVEEPRWLDLCAAPGGKTLTRIFAHRGRVETYANDSSNSRLQRLKAVLHDYLPPEVRARVHVSVCEGDRYRPARDVILDQVLVDAPCSGERHLLSDSKALEEWSESRSKGLAIRQHSLLCHALDIVKEGGHVVYSTCSLSALENDAVIAKLHKKRKGQFQLLEAPMTLGERTQYGVAITPDRDEYGPIYYSLLQKV